MTIFMAVINGHLLWSLSLSVLRLTACNGQTLVLRPTYS